MSKKGLHQLSKQATASKMCFEWGTTTTHISNILSTEDFRVDVHKDISNPGWAIANVQVNKGAKDPAAKELLKKGNTGPHKTTHKNIASIRYSQTNYDNDAFQRALEKANKAGGVTITVETGNSSGSGHGKSGSHGKSGESSKSSGQDIGEWEYDHDQRMHRYWDKEIWVYYDETEKREKFWDGDDWQWKA